METNYKHGSRVYFSFLDDLLDRTRQSEEKKSAPMSVSVTYKDDDFQTKEHYVPRMTREKE
jgi:hypothetical protein